MLVCKEEEEEAAEQEVNDKAQGTGEGGSGEEVQNKRRRDRRRGAFLQRKYAGNKHCINSQLNKTTILNLNVREI